MSGKRNFLFVLLLLSLLQSRAWAQTVCSDPIKVTNWCENTFAKWEFTSPTPNARYIWYSYMAPPYKAADFDAQGRIKRTGVVFYDSTANPYFYSPFRVTTAGIAPSTSVEFTYVKKTDYKAVPTPATTPTFTQGPAGGTFEMGFTLTDSIRFNSVRVPVVLTDPNQLYKIQITFETTAGPGSAIYTFSSFSGTKIPGVTNGYYIDVPVNYTVKGNGAHKIVVNSNPTGGPTGAVAVNGLLYSSTAPASSVSGPVTTGTAATGAGGYATLYDWNYTSTCVGSSGKAVKETAGLCCVPPTSVNTITISPDKTAIKTTESVNFSVTAYESTGNYFVWYLDGVKVAEGVGKISHVSSLIGTWEVREFKGAAAPTTTDIDNPSCYAKSSVYISRKQVEAKIDKAPTTTPLCIGDSWELSGTGAPVLKWFTGGGNLSNTTGTKTTFTATAPGYTDIILSGDVMTNNLVVNGDFTSTSTTSFTTSYAIGDPRSTDGGLGIASSAGSWGAQYDWSPVAALPFTQGNPGNFLVVNGAADGAKRPLVWGQKVTVQPGKDYTFSLDLSSVSYAIGSDMSDLSKPSIGPWRDVVLDIIVNGTVVGQASTNFAANGGTASVGKWLSFKFPWSAGSATSTATLEIRQVSPVPAQARGYDYGLDNISFGGLITQEDKITVGPIVDCSKIIADSSACIKDSLVDLTATLSGGLIFDHWELKSNPGVSVSTANPYRVKSFTATTYVAVGYLAVGNVLDNGNFDQGNNGFLSGGIYYDKTATYGDNLYNITSTTSSGNTGWWSDLPPAPGQPAGSLMYVTDAKAKEKVVGWTFDAKKDDKFAFSGWVANNHKGLSVANPDTVNSAVPAKIAIYINNQLVAVGATGPNQTWVKMTGNWTAPANGTYTLEVRNMKLLASAPGNDFALDGFVLAPSSGIVKKDETTTPVCDPCVNKAGIKDQTYCGNSGYVSLNLHSSELPGTIYSWYDKATNPSKFLGTTVGSAKDTIDLTGITADALGNKTVYYTKSAKAVGTVYKKSQSCDTGFDDNWENVNNGQNYFQSQFKNTTEIKITELSLALKSSLSNTDTKSGTFTISIVGAITSPSNPTSGLVANMSKVYGTFTKNWTRTKTAAEANDKIETLIFQGSTSVLPPGDFFIVVNTTNQSGNGQIMMGRSDCNQGVVWDDYDGATVSRNGGAKDGNGKQSGTGFVFDVDFEIPAAVCPRTPVTLNEDCPCSQPKTVIVNKTFDNDTTMCAGSTLVITGEYTLDLAKPAQKAHRYSWYKKVGTTITVITPPTLVTTSPITLSLTNLDSTSHSGTYFLKVEDGDGVTSNKSCYLQDSLKLTVNNPNKPVTPTTSQIICSGTKPAAFVTPIADAGVKGAGKYQWLVNNKKITGTTGNGQNYTFASPADTVFKNTTTANLVYTYIRRDSSGVCPAVNSNPVTITVMPVLKPGTISADQIICKGTAPAALTQTLPTGGSGTYDYQWMSSKDPAGPFVNVTGGTGATGSLYVPPILNDSIYYTRKVSITSSTCAAVYSDTIKISMVSPVIAGTVTPTEQKICYNAVPGTNLTSTAHKGGLKAGDVYTYQWQSLPDKANPNTGWVNIGTATAASYTFPATGMTDTTKYRLVVTGSCPAQKDTTNEVTVTVYPQLLPGTIAGGETICSGADPVDITNTKLPFGGANTAADWSYSWLVSVNGGAYAAATGTTSGLAISNLTNTTAAPITYEYKRVVTSTACPLPTAESNVVKYTITPALNPGTISADQTICKGAVPAAFTSTLATGGSGTYTYSWEQSANNIAYATATGGTGVGTDLFTPTAAVNAEVYYRRKVTSGTCPEQYSNTIKISLVEDMTAAVITDNQKICYNTTPVNLAIGTAPTKGLKTGDSYSYKWESLADATGSLWTATGITTQGYNFGATALTDTMKYRLVVTGSCGNTTSNEVTVIVLPELKGGTIAGGGTVCSGEDPADITNQALPTGANGTADYKYSWQVTANSVTSPAIPGGSSYAVPTFPANTGNAAVTYTVKRIVTSTYCPTPTAESNVLTYTVNPTVKPGVIKDDQTLCSGNTIDALVENTATTGGDGMTYSYQWQYSTTGSAGSFVNVTPTATGSSFTPDPQASTIYFARLDNSPGCQAVLTNSVKITINPGILAGSISSDQDICSGFAPAEIFTPPGKGPSNVSTAAVSTWESSPTGANGSWVPASAPLVPSQLTYQYPGTLTYGTLFIRKSVYDPNGPALCNTAQTAPVKIIIRDILTAGQIGSNQTICENGDPAAFTEIVAPTGGKDDEKYKYSWQYSANGITWTPIGTDNPVYDPGALSVTTRYRRVVNDALGCGPVNSNEVIVTVNPNLTPYVKISDPSESCQGELVKFDLIDSTNLGKNPTYEWTVGASVQGTNSPSFSTTSLANGEMVFLRVKSSEKCIKPGTDPAISNAVTVKILSNITPKIELATPDKICTGTTYTVIPKTATGGGATPTYQWFKNGIPVGSGGLSYGEAFNDGDEIKVIMTSVLGCVEPGTNPATSNTIKMEVLSIPQPNVVESDATFCSGKDTTYTAAVGTGTTFMWYKDDRPLNKTTSPLTVSESGLYYLKEDNGVCPRFSDTVTVVVIPTPIANAGSDIYVLENTNVTLNGSGGDHYSWSTALIPNFSNIPNPSFTATENTLYVLKVSDKDNICWSTDEVNVFVERPVKIPNAFTPNKDSQNDTWEIENISGFPNVTFEVYNRWGTLVWKSTGNLKQWDGTNYRNGEVLPDGTYFYVIDLHSVIFKDPYSGYVQILK